QRKVGCAMVARESTVALPVLGLAAETAEDLMTSNPVSLRDTATVTDAVALLTDKGFSAAPVIDAAGHPIGVLSRSDILTHDREKAARQPPASDGTALAQALPGHSEDTRVRDLMTPVVFSVAPETPVPRVVQEMLALNVHRLFVVDRDGVLIGVISALDVLRHLRPL